jgi:hypothetical protein
LSGKIASQISTWSIENADLLETIEYGHVVVHIQKNSAYRVEINISQMIKKSDENFSKITEGGEKNGK